MFWSKKLSFPEYFWKKNMNYLHMYSVISLLPEPHTLPITFPVRSLESTFRGKPLWILAASVTFVL